MVGSPRPLEVLMGLLLASGPALAQCGLQWAPLPGAGMAIGANSLTVTPNGDLYMVGWEDPVTFEVGASRWDGTSWTHWPNVFVNKLVWASAALLDGRVVAAGELVAPQSTYCPVVVWNGSTWGPLAQAGSQQFTYPSDAVCLTVMPNGDVVAGGSFQFPNQSVDIVRFDGSQWFALPARPGNSSVGVVRGLANGDLVAGSYVNSSTSVVHRWNGSSWTLFGTFGPRPQSSGADIHGICELPDGRIAVTGFFGSVDGVPARCVAIYDGTNWSALGAGIAGSSTYGQTVQALPNGDLLLGGFFSNVGGVAAANIARWNGATWSALGSGITGGSPWAYQIASRPQGDLVVHGGFTQAGGQPATNLARLVPPCPATTSNLGNGCASSAGPMQLTSLNLPWIGSTFRSTTTGIAPNSISFGLMGFTASAVPLVALHPAGLPGCTLLLDPILTILCATAGGSADFALALANQPALVGIPLYHQVLQAELTPGFDIAALAGSNALALVIGSL